MTAVDLPAATRSRAPRSAVNRLIRIELRLLVRDPLTLFFVFGFPVITMLIVGGSSAPPPAKDSTWSTRPTGTSPRT